MCVNTLYEILFLISKALSGFTVLTGRIHTTKNTFYISLLSSSPTVSGSGCRISNWRSDFFFPLPLFSFPYSWGKIRWLFCSVLKGRHCPDVLRQMCTGERTPFLSPSSRGNNEFRIPQHPVLKTSRRDPRTGGRSEEAPVKRRKNVVRSRRELFKFSRTTVCHPAWQHADETPSLSCNTQRQRGSTWRVMIMRKQKLWCVTFIFCFSDG